MLAHRRVEAASCHTDTRSLGPGIGAAVGITSQLAVPTATLRGCEPPISTARNLAVRADRPHSHPSYCCGKPCNPSKCHDEGTQDCQHLPLRRRPPSWVRLAPGECCMPWRNPALLFISLRVALWMTYLVPTAGQTLRMRAWRLTAQLHADGATFPHRHPRFLRRRRVSARVRHSPFRCSCAIHSFQA